MKIHVAGPGGAGKSTVGVLLSDRLQTPFVDLDQCFREREGDISDYWQVDTGTDVPRFITMYPR
jgi:shikimate kinase